MITKGAVTTIHVAITTTITIATITITSFAILSPATSKTTPFLFSSLFFFSLSLLSALYSLFSPALLLQGANPDYTTHEWLLHILFEAGKGDEVSFQSVKVPKRKGGKDGWGWGVGVGRGFFMCPLQYVFVV
jgi:hypothetical protein